MNFVGLDLAGSSKNKTGFCLLSTDGERKLVETRILYSNEEILKAVEDAKPVLTAVDAPLIYTGVNRVCDELLSKYGALPASLPGMDYLARRGVVMAKELSKLNIDFIEVNAKASAKILGVYNKDEFRMQKNMMSLNLDGDFTTRLLIKDELDAVSAALTAYLHNIGQTELVGDDSGLISIPNV